MRSNIFLIAAAAVIPLIARPATAGQQGKLPSDIAEEKEQAEMSKKAETALHYSSMMQAYYQDALAIRSAPVIAQYKARMRALRDQAFKDATEQHYDPSALPAAVVKQLNAQVAQIKEDYQDGMRVAEAQAQQDAERRVEETRSVEANENIAKWLYGGQYPPPATNP